MWRLFTIMIQDINRAKEVFLYTFMEYYGQDVRSIYNRIAEKFASTCYENDVHFILNETLEHIFSEDNAFFRRFVFSSLQGHNLEALTKYESRIE